MKAEKIDGYSGLGFKINMQILVDAYEEKLGDVTFMNKNNDRPHLTGARLYSKTNELKEQNVYIAKYEDIKEEGIPEDICFVVIGGKFKSTYKGSSCCIVLEDGLDPVDVLTETLEVLDENKAWDMKLQNALNLDKGIEELCSISYDYFKNPLFVHDNQFYILACPVVAEGMTKWEVDARTGMQMVSTEILNDFKIDEEYIQSMTTTRASIFSANQRGYRILYVNLWNDNGSWIGRLCRPVCCGGVLI